MNEYALKTKDGETIKKIKANDMTTANDTFAQLKKLSVGKLLEIYDVVLVD